MKAFIIGKGLIGSELEKRLEGAGHEVTYVAGRDGIYLNPKGDQSNVSSCSYEEVFSLVDVAFLAIPTFDQGEVAANYVRISLENTTPIVTCEKGSLSNNFADFQNDLDKIGYNATVGGGTRLLSYAKEQMSSRVREVHGVLNGTLNYILDKVGGVTSLGAAVSRAIDLGYAEPGAESPLEVINKEAIGDVPMKAAILCNILGLPTMKASSVEQHPLTLEDIDMLYNEATKRRYIVSLTRDHIRDDRIGGFDYIVNDDWILSAGFRNCEANPLYRRLIHSDVTNSLLISGGRDSKEDPYVVSGPGAGAGPTVSSMMKDMEELL